MSKRLLHLSDELALPLDFITMRTAEYGDSGAGKTTLARLIAEKVHEAGQRFGVIDLKNDWYGMKSSADGKSEGIPVVIFGGPRADVRLLDDASAGAAVADTVSSIDQSFIIDLDALSRRKQEIFLAAFLDRLYDVNRRPFLLFCDEADRYAPQKPMTQEAILSLSSSEDIARRGRRRGIGSLWITQRATVLNKNVSELANLLIVFRTPGSKDLDELQDRLGRVADKATVKEVMAMAPGLNDGEAVFLSAHPKLRGHMPTPVRPIQLPMPWTFDSSATPSVGQRRREPRVLAQADLAAIEEKMAAQVERAKADDPKALRAQIAADDKLIRALNKQLADEQAKRKPATKIEAKPVPIIKDGQVKMIEGLLTAMNGALDRACEAQAKIFNSSTVQRAYEKMVDLASAVQTIAKAQAVQETATIKRDPSLMRQIHKSEREITAGKTVPAKRAFKEIERDIGAESNGEIVIGESSKRLLQGLATLRAIGVDAPSRAAAGVMSGIRPTGGHFDRVARPLVLAGLIERGEGELRLTEQGIAEAPPPSFLEMDEYHAHLRKLFKGTTIKMLDVMIDAGPEAEFTREGLGEASGVRPTGGHFDRVVAPLSKVELVERKGGMIRPTANLFPEGLR